MFGSTCTEPHFSSIFICSLQLKKFDWCILVSFLTFKGRKLTFYVDIKVKGCPNLKFEAGSWFNLKTLFYSNNRITVCDFGLRFRREFSQNNSWNKIIKEMYRWNNTKSTNDFSVRLVNHCEWLTANRLTHFSTIIEMMAAENTWQNTHLVISTVNLCLKLLTLHNELF